MKEKEKERFCIAVVGRSMSGKTCFSRMLTGREFETSEGASILEDYDCQFTFEDDRILPLKIWDTVGQTREYGAINESAMKEANAFIILVNLLGCNNQIQVSKWNEDLKKQIELIRAQDHELKLTQLRTILVVCSQIDRFATNNGKLKTEDDVKNMHKILQKLDKKIEVRRKENSSLREQMGDAEWKFKECKEKLENELSRLELEFEKVQIESEKSAINSNIMKYRNDIKTAQEEIDSAKEKYEKKNEENNGKISKLNEEKQNENKILNTYVTKLDFNAAKEMANDYNCDFIKCSAKTGKGKEIIMEKLFEMSTKREKTKEKHCVIL